MRGGGEVVVAVVVVAVVLAGTTIDLDTMTMSIMGDITTRFIILLLLHLLHSPDVAAEPYQEEGVEVVVGVVGGPDPAPALPPPCRR